MAAAEPDLALAPEELELRDRFAEFVQAYTVAQAAGVDGQAVVVAMLREAMADQWDELPVMVRMMLG